jgi:hypothetical protein
MAGIQLLKIGVALIVVRVLSVIKRRRQDFFVVKRHANAIAEPVR